MHGEMITLSLTFKISFQLFRVEKLFKYRCKGLLEKQNLNINECVRSRELKEGGRLGGREGMNEFE